MATSNKEMRKCVNLTTDILEEEPQGSIGGGGGGGGGNCLHKH